MRFEREVYTNTEVGVAWLRETHLAGLSAPTFGSFVLAGDETAPVRLDLYKSVFPSYNEQPIETFHRDGDGVMIQGRPQGTPE
jgi:hypothetical protein